MKVRPLLVHHLLRNRLFLPRSLLESISLEFIQILFSSRKLELNSFKAISLDCSPFFVLVVFHLACYWDWEISLPLKYPQRLLPFVVFQLCKQPVGFMVSRREDLSPVWIVNRIAWGFQPELVSQPAFTWRNFINHSGIPTLLGKSTREWFLVKKGWPGLARAVM